MLRICDEFFSQTKTEGIVNILSHQVIFTEGKEEKKRGLWMPKKSEMCVMDENAFEGCGWLHACVGK